MKITTHILDTNRGLPASEVTVYLDFKEQDTWNTLANAVTNDDGRISHFDDLIYPYTTGAYRLRFEVSNYFKLHKCTSFYSEISVAFEVDEDRHYHVPLLLSPFSYSTYRGS